jgi:hypothetical protein
VDSTSRASPFTRIKAEAEQAVIRRFLAQGS